MLKPSNVDIFVPLVNMEIWKKLPHFVKGKDQKLPSMQNSIEIAASAVVQMADVLQGLSIPATASWQLLQLATDAIALFGYSNQQMSIRRRELIKPSLKAEYALLTNETTPITKQLFGDNLEKALCNPSRLPRDLFQTLGQKTGKTSPGSTEASTTTTAITRKTRKTSGPTNNRKIRPKICGTATGKGVC